MWAICKSSEGSHPVRYAAQSKAMCPAQPLIKCTRWTLISRKVVQKCDLPFRYRQVSTWECLCIFGKSSELKWTCCSEIFFQHLPPIRISAFWATAAFLSHSLYLDQEKKPFLVVAPELCSLYPCSNCTGGICTESCVWKGLFLSFSNRYLLRSSIMRSILHVFHVPLGTYNLQSESVQDPSELR